MYEFWTQEKLLLTIGLIEVGLIFVILIIIKVSQRRLSKPNMSNDNNSSDLLASTIASSVNAELTLMSSEENGNESIPDETSANLPEETVNVLASNDLYKVAISSELFTELLEISNDPKAIVDEAIRWWLRRRNLNALESSINFDRRDRLSSGSYSTKKSSQDLWND